MAATELTKLDHALSQLLADATAIDGSETVPLEQSIGRVLAQDYRVPADVPPADNSAVDGYAVRAADLEQNQPLPISSRIPAGAAPSKLASGTAARIFTGSEVPAGADSVIMQERVQVTDAGITVEAPITPGQNIRRQGQDLAKGELALAAGTPIRPQEMGLLASIGLSDILVKPRLKVAVFSTGDELVEPGERLAPGQIYNTNRFTLLGLLERAGCKVVVCDTLKDNREKTRDALDKAAENADLIITSGGVSVGEEDHVRAVLEDAGQLSLWRLAIKPGKPLAYGRLNKTPLLGLPGNPAAVLVTFLIVAMPLIRLYQGRSRHTLPGTSLPAGFAVEKASIRREFMRARLETNHGRVEVKTFPNQSSGVLSSACWADGLAVIPENATVEPGDPITYLSFAELLS